MDETPFRCQKGRWFRIGVNGHRSLWARLQFTEQELEKVQNRCDAMGLDFAISNLETVVAIELCAGRDGDDSYVSISRNNPDFAQILDVINTALYAADMSSEDPK